MTEVKDYSEAKTMSDKLTEAFMEECEGVVHYAELANMVEAAYPKEPYADILRKIAMDEHTHKRLILQIIEDMDAFMPENIKKAIDEADHAYSVLRTSRR